jgi:hypothetical protein
LPIVYTLQKRSILISLKIVIYMWVIPHQETGVACSRNWPPSPRGRSSVVLFESCISELAGVSTSSINPSPFLLRPSAALSSLSPSFCQLLYKDGILGLRLSWYLQLLLLLVAGIRPALCNSIFPSPLLVGLCLLPCVEIYSSYILACL